MQDGDKTREQLIAELVALRMRIAEFEELEAKRKRLNQEPLMSGEILMELGCLARPQLEEALKKQEELSMLGQRRKLLTIIVESGVITGEQMRIALEFQEIRIKNARLEARCLNG